MPQGAPPITPELPDPQYIVELAAVEEVRVGWLDGQRIVILRHPCRPVSANAADHPPFTNRLSCDGPHLSGRGPVTIWRDDQLLYFTDDPWLLLSLGPDAAPALLSAWDHHAAGGPIELRVTSAVNQAGSSIGVGGDCWLDSECSGANFTLQLDAAGPSGMPCARILRILNDAHHECGRLDLSPAERDSAARPGHK